MATTIEETNTTPTVSAPSISTTGLTSGGSDASLGTSDSTTAAAPTFSAREVKPEETVAGQMDTLLAKDSPYITAGQTASAQESNARGLLNTSMGVEAGEVARIKSVLDVASPDAATYASAASAAQDAEQTATLEGYRGDITKTINEQEGQITYDLSAQNYEQSFQLENFAQERLDTREDRSTFLSMATGAQQEYQQALLAIQLTPDSEMSSEAKLDAIATLNTSSQSQIEMISSLYEVPITWSSGITPVPKASPPAPAPTQPYSYGAPTVNTVEGF